ncbi:Vegetative incompatibility protein HET-E-1 [Lachnellula hyalina]|uniref:Vegetative incompatibility protein HET-E-1 n=1 Tax=Lachnellula hyalina TaxID=1316788 RepID=A0A8H8TZN7_9HELO|nr:Vegetative incompatibility protein HET-E-1 [Lachnellula hyalina]TVY26062.1 Vegetative incompatibility protein HET-E-1 [Lachnellula hyalina]
MDEQITRLSLGSIRSTGLNVRSNNDMWAQAVEHLSAEDKANINFSYDKLETLSSLHTDAKDAQKKCEDNRLHFKRRSGEKVILRDLFGKVVKWIDLFKQVGDTAVQYDPGHAALPWALVRFLLQATVNDIEKYEILEQLYVDGTAAAVEQLESALVRLYSAILLCLSKLKSYLNRRKADSKRQKILKWMSDIEKIPYLKHHKENKRQMLSGTGHWLLEDRTFKDWKDDSASSLLWLHGIPGSGKSKLTSLVIEDTVKCAIQDQIPRPAYFYCSRNSAEPLRSDSNAILGSIARQLASVNPISPLLPPAVQKYAEEEVQGATSTSLDVQDSSELISGLLDLYPTAFIIIDALDECTPETRIDLLDFIKATLDTSACLVKFFISSREDGEIMYQLNKFPNVEISSTKNQGDIEAFVESETTNLVKRGTLLRNSRGKKALEAEITKKLSRDAGGMFRWASMQLQHLTTLKTDEDILHHLGKIPPSLEVLYKDIYERIAANHGSISKVLARNTFSLLLRLKENLLLSEFIKLVQDNEEGFSSAMPSNTILDICCNLVVLDKTLDIFRFAHLSVREFFEKLPEFNHESTHSTIAICCMKHIDMAERSKPYEWWNQYGPKPIKMIGDYIDLWLLHHLHSTSCDERMKAQFLKHTTRLLSRADFSSLFQNPSLDKILPVPRTINSNLSSLFNACAGGFSEILKLTIFYMQDSGRLPSSMQLSAKSILPQDLESLKRTGELFLPEGTQNLAPDVVTLLAKHAISHGSFVVLHFLLHENLCTVTEEMLLQAVNAYCIRKTSGSEWREPAVIVDLMLHNAVRQKVSGLLKPYPMVAFDKEFFPGKTRVSNGAERHIKHLLTPAVIEKAVATIRLASTSGIQVLVTHVLIKWGAKILLTKSLDDSILRWSPDESETIFLFLKSHDDLHISWDFLEHIGRRPGDWFQNDSDCLRLIRNCAPAEITQEVL